MMKVNLDKILGQSMFHRVPKILRIVQFFPPPLSFSDKGFVINKHYNNFSCSWLSTNYFNYPYHTFPHDGNSHLADSILEGALFELANKVEEGTALSKMAKNPLYYRSYCVTLERLLHVWDLHSSLLSTSLKIASLSSFSVRRKPS